VAKAAQVRYDLLAPPSWGGAADASMALMLPKNTLKNQGRTSEVAAEARCS